MRFLLIGVDRKLNFQVLYVLKTIGYIVEVIEDINEANDILKSRRFDLIIFNSEQVTSQCINIMVKFINDGGVSPFMFVVPSLNDGIHALKKGADDYIQKPFIPCVFIARVKALMRRCNNYQANMLSLGPLKLDVFSRNVWLGDNPIKLSRCEKGILEFFLKHLSRRVTQEQIMSYLCLIDNNICYQSIEENLNSLKSKVKHPSIEIKTTWGCGYVLELVK